MTTKELKKLSRLDLLNILVEQSRQNDGLKKENERLKDELRNFSRNRGTVDNKTLEKNEINSEIGSENELHKSENISQHSTIPPSNFEGQVGNSIEAQVVSILANVRLHLIKIKEEYEEQRLITAEMAKERETLRNYIISAQIKNNELNSMREEVARKNQYLGKCIEGFRVNLIQHSITYPEFVEVIDILDEQKKLLSGEQKELL